MCDKGHLTRLLSLALPAADPQGTHQLMLSAMLGPILGVGEKLIDRWVPDPKQKHAAKMQVMEMAQRGEFREIEIRMSAILAEANSDDPWTSRARPSFLYVCYLLILAAIPMGVISAISPETGLAIAAGFKAWLEAIPSDLYTLMTVGYLGYNGARSFDKTRKLKHHETVTRQS